MSDYFIMSPMRLCSKVFIYIPVTLHTVSPGGSDAKESACNVGHQGSIPGLGRSPGEGNSHPLPYSGEFHGLGKESQRVRHDWVTFTTLHSGHYICFCSLCRKFILGISLRQIKMSHKIIAIKMGLRVWHSWELTGQSNTKAFSSHSVSLILW